MKKISWRQKAREIWTRFGDRNTKLANINRRRNHLDCLDYNGIRVRGQIEVASAAIDFFKSLYSEPHSSRVFPEEIEFRRVPQEANSVLCGAFTEDEIALAVRNCAGDKAPGPDGFSIDFFKRYWTMVKADVCVAFKDFFECASLSHAANSSFVVLIPKKDAVEEFKDLFSGLFLQYVI